MSALRRLGNVVAMGYGAYSASVILREIMRKKRKSSSETQGDDDTESEDGHESQAS